MDDKTEIENIGRNLCYAIQNGIREGEEYPRAYIQNNGSLVIECTERVSQYKAFAKIFPDLCQSHGIDKLVDADTYCSYQETTKNSEQVSKFTFNISPKDCHNLLMHECSAYQDYRNNTGLGGSILLLENPYLEAHKDGVICAFPVFVMEDNQVMIRNAGCNVSELISTQLSYLVSEYLPSEAEGKKPERYGHWRTKMTENLTGDYEAFVNVAIQCITETDQHYYLQEMDGWDVVTLRPGVEKWLQEVDKSNENIHNLLGIVSKQELSSLKSLEIPTEIYLNQLLADLQDGLGKNSTVQEDPQMEAMRQDFYTQLEKNIANVTSILDGLKNSKQDSNLNTTRSSPLGSKDVFFKSGEGKQEIDEPTTPKPK